MSELIWNAQKPTEPGHYWVWAPGDTWPCRGKAHMVLVERDRSELVAWVPFMDFADPLSADTWDETLWLGPVTAPTLPDELD